MKQSQRDSLYAEPLGEIERFAFDDAVAAVFPDMIKRSVPGYGLVVNTIGLLARQYAQAGSRCYDLGCSLGAVTLSMRHQLEDVDVSIIAVDNAEAMARRCAETVQAYRSTVPVEVVCADVRDLDIRDASVVVLNFTLQFIAVADRDAIIKKIFDGLRPGGVLVLAEKIAFSDADEGRFHEDMHFSFKRANGYSGLEISQKRTALENVLLADTSVRHRQRLLDAGFAQCHLWFQCFNFAAMIAHKK